MKIVFVDRDLSVRTEERHFQYRLFSWRNWDTRSKIFISKVAARGSVLTYELLQVSVMKLDICLKREVESLGHPTHIHVSVSKSDSRGRSLPRRNDVQLPSIARLFAMSESTLSSICEISA